jgi:hypothetical protein
MVLPRSVPSASSRFQTRRNILTHPRQASSRLILKIILFISLFAILSLFIGFKTIHSATMLQPTVDDRDHITISKSGQMDSPLDDLRPTIHINDGLTSITDSITSITSTTSTINRKKAIEEAMKQTNQYLHQEERLQRYRDAEKEAYLQKVAEEEQIKKQKEEELEQEQQDLMYYMYYEDSNDEKTTVIGMASAKDLLTFQRFVGSLRQTGFGGVIILGVEDPSPEVLAYLSDHDVIVKTLEPIACTFEAAKKDEACYQPYTHIKREWAHFPLARDWLSACASCTGPVVFTSVDDTYFQNNPFGKGMPVVKRLHLYEQHPSVDVAQTSAGVLLKACYDIDLAAEMEADSMELFPMRGILSANTALGTRDDIIDYLGSVYSIFRQWMQKPECHFSHSDSDAGMAVVNFLRIRDRLPYRTRIMIHRTGIVNNADFEGKNALDAHVHLWKFRGLSEEDAQLVPFEGSQGSNWIDADYMVTDKDGDFIDVFLQKSAIIYGYHSYGPFFLSRLDKSLGIKNNDATTRKKETTTITKQAQAEKDTTVTATAVELPAAKPDEPLRKKKIGKMAEMPDDKKKVIEGMYYDPDGQQDSMKESKDSGKVITVQSNPVVPVKETKEKETTAADEANNSATDDSVSNVQAKDASNLEGPVDKKFETEGNVSPSKR